MTFWGIVLRYIYLDSKISQDIARRLYEPQGSGAADEEQQPMIPPFAGESSGGYGTAMPVPSHSTKSKWNLIAKLTSPPDDDPRRQPESTTGVISIIDVVFLWATMFCVFLSATISGQRDSFSWEDMDGFTRVLILFSVVVSPEFFTYKSEKEKC
jgi:hypothetical protein